MLKKDVVILALTGLVLVSFISCTNKQHPVSAKSKVSISEKYEPIKQNINNKIYTYKSKIEINAPRKQRIKFHVTYYTNKNNRLQGGQLDKKSKPLTSHNFPVLALPKDVPYGVKVLFEEEVNGSREYINVDTGGAIKWLNKEKTECKVDIFIPNVSEKWLMNNADNKIVDGWIVYNE